jgi:hypothetical protein
MKAWMRACAYSALLGTGVFAGCVSADLPPISDGSGGGSSSGASSSGGGGTGGAAGSSSSSSTSNPSGTGGEVTTYNDMTKGSLWSTFDTKQNVAGNPKGFRGAGFDGRYVYFVPNDNYASGLVTRYDTQGLFTDPGSWTTFDLTGVDPNARGFSGAAFDGRYLYLPQFQSPPGTYAGRIARYDTLADFQKGSSWSIFDATTLHTNARAFWFAMFDGRRVYFLPYGYAGFDGQIASYDTQGTFSDPGAWSTFAPSSLDSNFKGCSGDVFDGRYAYFACGGPALSRTVRYDTQASFSNIASWTSVDAQTFVPGADGAPAAFDGRYVYLVPGVGPIARYDTQGSLTAAASWSKFDALANLDPKAKRFAQANFDGRYVYFVPNGFDALDGLMVRYDTEGTFTAAGAWSKFDLTQVNPGATGFSGSVFDGRFLYLVPDAYFASGLVARFDAKTPPSMPNLPGWNGFW